MFLLLSISPIGPGEIRTFAKIIGLFFSKFVAAKMSDGFRIVIINLTSKIRHLSSPGRWIFGAVAFPKVQSAFWVSATTITGADHVLGAPRQHQVVAARYHTQIWPCNWYHLLNSQKI